MIVKLVKQRLLNIEKGYKIIDKYADDCDEYGPLYWIECRNGWSGRDYDLPDVICNSVRIELINIVDNGLRINGKLHFIDPRAIFSNKYLMEISEEQYLDNIKSKESLTELKQKLKVGANQCRHVIYRSTGISISQDSIENLVSVYNPHMFKLTFWTILATNRSNIGFKETVKELLESIGYNRKKTLYSIIESSDLTNKENKVLEDPIIET